ncbi:hypothetical protein VM98_30160 [Streptomyces rubellomurinus subsp. indigoferus]|nr:hypothetical protein VM98_30160 [Streptomyces rubellomurinus subsp. indigoferus]
MSTAAVPRLSSLDGALSRGLRHLAARRDPDGLWRDFRTPAGASSHWVTGFVCCSLAEADAEWEVVGPAARQLVTLQRRDGGWAYNGAVPSDADSTAWALLALTTVTPWRQSAAMRAARYLVRHQEPISGGISTYDALDGIHRFIGAAPDAVGGWTQPHVCVTASALMALAIHGRCDRRVVDLAADDLRRSRAADGLWRSYWWPGVAYPTAVAVQALGSARRADPALLGRVHDAFTERAGGPGGWCDDPEIGPSAFATALAMRALMSCRPRVTEALAAAARHLLDSQAPDGSWPTAPVFRIPPPEVLTPAPEQVRREGAVGTGVLVSDVDQVFGAAAAVGALARFRTLLRDRSG